MHGAENVKYGVVLYSDLA